MNGTSKTGGPARPEPGLAERLDRIEAHGRDVTKALSSIVDGLVGLKSSTERIHALERQVQELEQQVAFSRTREDLVHVSRVYPKERSIVFVGTTWLGCNVKYAWLAARAGAERHGYRCWFLPFTAEQEAQVRSVDRDGCFPHAHEAWTPDHVHGALSAAVLVTSDHLLNPNPLAAAMLAGARHVQLWHGVSIKEIGLRNVPPLGHLSPHAARVLATCGPYATLVGTAAAHEPEWRRWFAFERYAPLGYARNDVLYRAPAGADLLNVDREAFDRAARARAAGHRVVLYAPTFRDANPGRWLLDAGLARIARSVAAAGDLLMVNLHPVEAPILPELRRHLPDVAFVQPRTDAHPLLTRTSALVTDYSSILFDYLHLDRPVLLYRPDHEDYTRRSRTLFDGKLATIPGPLATTPDALVRALGEVTHELHAQARHRLRAQLFDHHDGGSGTRLVDLLVDELDRARPARAA